MPTGRSHPLWKSAVCPMSESAVLQKKSRYLYRNSTPKRYSAPIHIQSLSRFSQCRSNPSAHSQLTSVDTASSTQNSGCHIA